MKIICARLVQSEVLKYFLFNFLFFCLHESIKTTDKINFATQTNRGMEKEKKSAKASFNFMLEHFDLIKSRLFQPDSLNVQHSR